ncbi:unnamed protein product [Clavelina lepadiformis]|uniref:EGF-like domain-containing protein n=1 Tax=Clavelina lepadiformis TaxID=159417 RepID=A0ABP0GIX1_CLALP
MDNFFSNLSLTVVLAIQLFQENKACDDHAVNNVEHIARFDLLNEHNFSTYEISIKVSWNLNHTFVDIIDGFLFCFSDPDVYTRRSKYLSCSQYINEHNNTCLSNRCHETFPCSRNRIVERGGSHYDCYCPVDEIGNTNCTICEPFSGQCQILSKDRRNVFFPAHFGRVYEFYIRALSGDCMDPSRTFQNVNSIFCVQQLVEMVGIPLDDAIPFCEKEQTLPESYMSGPVTNLTVCNVADNIVENSLNVEVCWEDPLDLKSTTSISFYYLQWLHPGKKRPLGYKQVNSHFSNNDSKDSFHYKQSITKLIYNEMYLFRVTPVYEEGWDYEEGVVREITYTSGDLDGCASKYCDSRARCVDFSPGSSTPAKCSCPYNFTGNGISTSIEGGTGCIGPCQTQASLYCHPMASCTDDEHIAARMKCQCPNSYFGDGTRQGSGCLTKGVVGLITAGILLFVLISPIFCFVAKNKCLKRKVNLRRYAVGKPMVKRKGLEADCNNFKIEQTV